MMGTVSIGCVLCLLRHLHAFHDVIGRYVGHWLACSDQCAFGNILWGHVLWKITLCMLRTVCTHGTREVRSPSLFLRAVGTLEWSPIRCTDGLKQEHFFPIFSEPRS